MTSGREAQAVGEGEAEAMQWSRLQHDIWVAATAAE